MTPDIDLAIAYGWRKATYSSQNGSCVEVGQTPVGAVAIRDTTDRPGPSLSVPASAWRVFLGTIAGARESDDGGGPPLPYQQELGFQSASLTTSTSEI